MGILRRKRRVMAAALAVALLASVVLLATTGLAVVDQEVLINGNFEGGFTSVSGCGAVGVGWGCFTNGGTITYAFFDDQWDKVVADGKHSQGIELNTLQYAASEADRFAGIYQTVNLVKGGTYQLKASGLMREKAPNASEDQFRYRVQWGYTTNGSTDWTTVGNWIELPWNEISERTAPSSLQSFGTSFVAPSSKVTVFLRVWKKWGTAYKDLDVNLDAVSLFGPGSLLTVAPPPLLPTTGGLPVVIPPATGGSAPIAIPPASGGNAPIAIPPAAGNPVPVIIPPAVPGQVVVIPPASVEAAPVGAAQAATCSGGNYLRNGSFEGGFANGTGYFWNAFNNGGATNYGNHDDTWGQVVRDGNHAQLIEINTRNMGAADGNRFAGIYQVVGGLVPGQTYELSLWGEMREDPVGLGEDPYRYRVQWGYAAAGGNPTWTAIANWSELPWNDIYQRAAGGALLPFSARFTAPSNSIVIAVRALKKWGTPNRELNVDVDAAVLASCQAGQPPVVYVPPVYVPPAYGYVPPAYVPPAYVPPVHVPVVYTQPVHAPPPAKACTWYTVKRGDNLNSIARRYGRSAASIMAGNKISNPNKIYVGQRLCIC